MTTQQAGEFLGVTPGRIRQYIAEGRLQPEKAGQMNLIPEAQMHALKKVLLDRPTSTKGPKPRVMRMRKDGGQP